MAAGESFVYDYVVLLVFVLETIQIFQLIFKASLNVWWMLLGDTIRTLVIRVVSVLYIFCLHNSCIYGRMYCKLWETLIWHILYDTKKNKCQALHIRWMFIDKHHKQCIIKHILIHIAVLALVNKRTPYRLAPMKHCLICNEIQCR